MPAVLDSAPITVATDSSKGVVRGDVSTVGASAPSPSALKSFITCPSLCCRGSGSSPQRMPVQYSSPKPPHADAISRGRSVRGPVASASSSAHRSGPFVLGPSGSPTPSRVVSGHLGGDHSRRRRLPQGTECSRQPTPGSVRLQGNLARVHEEIPRPKRPSTRNSLKPEDRQPQLSSLTDQQN